MYSYVTVRVPARHGLYFYEYIRSPFPISILFQKKVRAGSAAYIVSSFLSLFSLCIALLVATDCNLCLLCTTAHFPFAFTFTLFTRFQSAPLSAPTFLLIETSTDLFIYFSIYFVLSCTIYLLLLLPIFSLYF